MKSPEKRVHVILTWFVIVLAAFFRYGSHKLHTYSAGNGVPDAAMSDEYVQIVNDIQDDVIIYSASTHKESYCKIKAKKKVKNKVRYRAMYCQLRLTPKDLPQNTLPVYDGIISTYTSCLLHDEFAYSFTLRGPPPALA